MHRYHAAPRFYGIMICLLLLFFSVSFGVSFGQLKAETIQYNKACAERDSLKCEIADLHQEFMNIQTDEYIERLAREELGMLYPGEIRYVTN